jgi:hypothetical protein
MNALMYRLIVQVGFTESVRSLHGHALHFFGPNSGVQVYLFLKIWKKRADDTRAMAAVVYHRTQDHPISFLSIGSAALHSTFLQFYTRLFPGVLLPPIQQNGVTPAASNSEKFAILIPGNVIDPNMDLPLPDLQLDLSDLCDRIISFP